MDCPRFKGFHAQLDFHKLKYVRCLSYVSCFPPYTSFLFLQKDGSLLRVNITVGRTLMTVMMT